MTKDFFQLQNNTYNNRFKPTHLYQPSVKVRGIIVVKHFVYSQKPPRTFRTNIYTTAKRNKLNKKSNLRQTKKNKKNKKKMK